MGINTKIEHLQAGHLHSFKAIEQRLVSQRLAVAGVPFAEFVYLASKSVIMYLYDRVDVNLLGSSISSRPES